MKTASWILGHLVDEINFYESLGVLTDKEKLEWVEKTVVEYKKIVDKIIKKDEEVKIGGTD